MLCVVYALYPDTGQLQVGNAAPDFNTYDNTTLYQIYEDVAEVLNPAFITAPVIAITDRSLQLNAENGSTAFLTLMYVNSTTYFENDTLDPVLFGSGGTAWNVCVWEGCPTDSSTGGSTGKIVCAYGQSNAFRHLIPFFDDEGNLVHLQMNWIQSNNILREAGLPGNQSDLVLFVSLLTRVGDLPSDTPVPEPETE